MRRTSILLIATCTLAAFVSGDLLAQTQPPVPSSPKGSPSPRQDAITVEGCLSRDTLEITTDDPSNLTGVRTLRLVGTRAIRQRMRELHRHLVRVTGELKLKRSEPAPDRLDTRAKRKVGDKTTVYVGAAAEQRSAGASTDPDRQYDLDVTDLQAVAPSCPGSK